MFMLRRAADVAHELIMRVLLDFSVIPVKFFRYISSLHPFMTRYLCYSLPLRPVIGHNGHYASVVSSPPYSCSTGRGGAAPILTLRRCGQTSKLQSHCVNTQHTLSPCILTTFLLEFAAHILTSAIL